MFLAKAALWGLRYHDGHHHSSLWGWSGTSRISPGENPGAYDSLVAAHSERKVCSCRLTLVGQLAIGPILHDIDGLEIPMSYTPGGKEVFDRAVCSRCFREAPKVVINF